MCGRFIVSYTYDDLLKFMNKTFDIFDLDDTLDVPSYNVAPGQDVISVISDGTNYRAGTFKWGFIPHFAKDKKSGYKMINARIEGIKDKASFKHSFVHKRCLILADGYYEWKKVGNQKQPYLIQKSNKEMFFFPGLWSKAVIDDEIIYSCTIITTEANELLKDVHHRMPIILDEVTAKKWLDKTIVDTTVLDSILQQSKNDNVTKMQVSSFVNNVRNNSIDCIQEFKENKLF